MKITTADAAKIMKRCQVGTRNYNEANDLHAECYGMIGSLLNERDRLQNILDNRPAINAGLPETYVEWSQGIYMADYAQVVGHAG